MTPTSRRTFLGGAAAVTGAVALGGPVLPAAAATDLGVPGLPAGFADTFSSRYVNIGGLRLHAMVGGHGKPLLLIHGWPMNWYEWRLVMPALARDHRVVAVDQRGMGLSDKPQGGYDAGTLANDLVALMDKLGHQRFSLVGHDTGMVIGYALAADHRDRVDRLVLSEAPLPGAAPGPGLFDLDDVHNEKLWHIGFNRARSVNELLVQGREDIFFGNEFAVSATKKLPDYVVNHYIRGFAASRDNLRGSFGVYRALGETYVQNQKRVQNKLTLPVLAVGGQDSLGAAAAQTVRFVATDVQGLVVSGGHFVADESPHELLAGLVPFLNA